MTTRTVFLAYGSSLFGVVVSLTTTFWLYRAISLGSERVEFGLLTFIASMAAYLQILQAGIDVSFGFFLAEAHAKNDLERAARFYRQMVLINRMLSLFCGILTVASSLLALRYATTVFGETADPILAARLIFLAGLGQSMLCLTRSDAIALTGSQALHFVNLTRITTTLIGTIGGYLYFRSGLGVAALPAGELTGYLLWSVTLRVVCRWKCPWTQYTAIDPWRDFATTARYAFSILVMCLGQTLEMGCDAILLTTMRPHDGLIWSGILALWVRLPIQANAISSLLSTSGVPSLQALYSVDVAGACLLLHRVQTAVLAISACMILGVSSFLTPVMHHWLGGYADIDRGPLLSTVLATGLSLRTVYALPQMHLLAFGWRRAVVILCWVQGIAKIAIAIVLIPTNPLLGIAVATLSSSAIGWFAISAMLLRRGDSTFPRILTQIVTVGLSAVFGYGLGQLTIGGDRMETIFGIAAMTVLISLFVATVLIRMRRHMKRVAQVPQPFTTSP